MDMRHKGVPVEKEKGDERQYRVLLVDDETLSQEIGKLHFGSLGCRVETASNGAEALELTEREAFDLILIDYYLADMNGDQLSRMLRSQQKNQCASIIAISNDPSSSYRSTCLAAGMDEAIEKPLTMSLSKDLMARYILA